MAANESLKFDGLELNDLAVTGTYQLESVQFPPPGKRAEWASNPDADGAALVTDPRVENRVVTATVSVLASTRDLVNDAIGALVDRVEQAERTAGGLPLVWTPADGTRAMTFTVLSGTVGAPAVTHDQGYFALRPVVTLELQCESFATGVRVESQTITFAATSDLDLFAFDAGSGTLSVSGGQLVPSATGEKRLYYTRHRTANARVAVKVTTGASAAGFTRSVPKRLDATNYLRVSIGGGDLVIAKVDGGVVATLANVAFALAASTSYWVRGLITGNVIRAEAWTSAPTPTGTPAASVEHTLTGANATKFGAGVTGDQGMVLDPAGTDWRFDDFVVEPNVFRGGLPALEGSVVVTGDAPADATVILTDTAGQTRAFAEFGADRSSSTTSLLVDSDSMTGTGGTASGAYDPDATGNSVMTVVVAAGGTAMLAELPRRTDPGAYRVRARVQATQYDAAVRVTVQDGDGAVTVGAPVEVTAADVWRDVDLGTVVTSRASWRLTLDAVGGAAAATVLLDYVTLVPVGVAYGRARAVGRSAAGAVRGSDDFASGSGNLNGRTATVGGAWATSGAAVDFTQATGYAERSLPSGSTDASPRFALLGTARTDTAATLRVLRYTHEAKIMLIARYVDASNYLRYEFDPTGTEYVGRVVQVVAGTATTLASKTGPKPAEPHTDPHTFYLTVYADGSFTADSLLGGGDLTGSSTALATGGTLASGTSGFAEQQTLTDSTVTSRRYDSYTENAPAARLVVIHSGRSASFSTDEQTRESADGALTGPVPEYRGSRVLLPPSGRDNIPVRVLARARRLDITNGDDTPVIDSLQLQVAYTPRYLVVPR